MKRDVDIVIVGAGMSGLSLAACLQNQPYKICLLEKHLPAVLQGHEDVRPISLSYTSQQLLQTLGLWQTLAFSASAIEAVHISQQNQFGAVRINAEAIRLPVLGYVLPYCELQKSLYQWVVNLPNVEIVPIQNLQSVSTAKNNCQIQFVSKNQIETITCRLIIGADGAHSAVRELSGIDAEEKSVEQVAMTATVSLNRNSTTTAYERFSTLGTFAILPGQVKQCGLVWTMPVSQWTAVEAYSAQDYCRVLQETFGYRLGRILEVTRTGSYRLDRIISQRQQQPGLILIGNAAHTFLPLAAQSLNLSLRDIALLAELIVSDQLDAYETKRQSDQKNIMRLTEVAQVWQKIPILKTTKMLGFLAAELFPGLEQWVAKLGVGHGGYVPKLMRGLKLTPTGLGEWSHVTQFSASTTEQTSRAETHFAMDHSLPN